jgi:hypothetical protein
MTSSRSNLNRARRAFSVALIGSVAFLSACSSSTDSSTTTAVSVVADSAVPNETAAAAESQAATGADPAGVDPAAQKAFTDCLKENGVELPAGGLGAAGAGGGLPEGVDPAKLQTAFAACGDNLPAGAAGRLPGLGGGAAGASGPDLSAFTTCLKDNGVTVPEPFDISKLDLKDPAFTAASQTCAPLLPAGLPAGSGAVPTTIAAG